MLLTVQPELAEVAACGQLKPLQISGYKHVAANEDSDILRSSFGQSTIAIFEKICKA